VEQEVSHLLDMYNTSKPSRGNRNGIHVTTLLDPCLRKLAYELSEIETIPDKHDPGLERKFNIGHACHHWWQNEYYGPMRLLTGKWRCSSCGTVVNGFKPDSSCGNAIYINDPSVSDDLSSIPCIDNSSKWIFMEPEVEYDYKDLHVVGSCDGILFYRDELHVLEMKNMESSQWKELKVPREKYVKQANTYAWLLGIEKLFISCINMETWQTKDFVLDADVDGARDWIRFQLDALSVILGQHNPQAGPKACSSKNTVRAKRCGLRNKCF
jgi:hypothetical protein